MLAQQRLGPGRIHHCMRWLGQSRRAFDMLCERAVSRYTHGSYLAEKQTIQNWVADSMAEMHGGPADDAARRVEDGPGRRAEGPGRDRHDQVLRRPGALQRDRPRHPDPRLARLLHRPAARGTCTAHARAARIYDGPDEVHKVTVARKILKGYKPVDVPTEHVPTRREAATEKFADLLDAGDGRPLKAGAGAPIERARKLVVSLLALSYAVVIGSLSVTTSVFHARPGRRGRKRRPPAPQPRRLPCRRRPPASHDDERAARARAGPVGDRRERQAGDLDVAPGARHPRRARSRASPTA